MSKSNNKEKTMNVSGVLGQGHETYLTAAGEEAAQRVGRGPQLKGVVHEVLRRDQKNATGVLQGKITKLTKAKNAGTVDLVTMQNGKVVEREQLKDIVSRAGATKTKEQLQSGKYNSAKIVTTTEGEKLLGKQVGTKNIESSGISSARTTRIADNTGAKVPNKNLLKSNFQDIGNMAQSAATTGAVIGSVVTAVSEFSDLQTGKIDTVEYGMRVGKAAVVSAIDSGTRTAGALAIKEGGKQIAKQIGTESAKRLAGSNVATAVAFGVVDQVWQTGKFITGDIDGAEYGKNTAQNVGSTAGAIAGAETGAALGTCFCPGIGTAIGAGVGGLVGAIGGGALGRGLASWW